jgi:hypothetical protein
MNTDTGFPVSPRADVTPESSDRTAGVLARRGDEGDVITSAEHYTKDIRKLLRNLRMSLVSPSFVVPLQRRDQRHPRWAGVGASFRDARKLPASADFRLGRTNIFLSLRYLFFKDLPRNQPEGDF